MESLLKRYRALKRRIMNNEKIFINKMWPYYLPVPSKPIKGLRYFCQNAGSCGSMYIVELMKINGFTGCYHEKDPDLDVLGIAHYEGHASEKKLKRILTHTRRGVFFFFFNRLFSMTKLLKESFPDSRFIHLHRDPRDLIPSSLSKPPELTWDSGRPRYTSTKLCGPVDTPLLERACRYWTNYNQRILADLIDEDYLSLEFSDLISGNVSFLEEFLGGSLNVKKIPPVNADKPVRIGGRHQPFEDFSIEDKDTLLSICGPIMENWAIKYERFSCLSDHPDEDNRKLSSDRLNL